MPPLPTTPSDLDQLVPYVDRCDATGLAHRLKTAPYPSETQLQRTWEHLLGQPQDGQAALLATLMAKTDWEIRSFVLSEAIEQGRQDVLALAIDKDWRFDTGHLQKACQHPAYEPTLPIVLAQISAADRADLWVIQMSAGMGESLVQLARHWVPDDVSAVASKVLGLWEESRCAMNRNPADQHARLDRALATLVDLPEQHDWIQSFLAAAHTEGLVADGATFALTLGRQAALARAQALADRPAPSPRRARPRA